MKNMMIGLDLAKSVFHVHGASMTRLMAEQPEAIVIFEACGSVNYWAREMEKLGHGVRLIVPHFVRPFVKHQKNDATDAEAIVIAAQRSSRRCGSSNRRPRSNRPEPFYSAVASA